MARYLKADFAKKEGITDAVLNSWIYKHGLPVVQIGRRTYIEESDFQAWWDSHKKVITKVAPVRSKEIALPKQCRNPGLGILSKLRPAR